jgi:hypothetical protein
MRYIPSWNASRGSYHAIFSKSVAIRLLLDLACLGLTPMRIGSQGLWRRWRRKPFGSKGSLQDSPTPDMNHCSSDTISSGTKVNPYLLCLRKTILF